jgi:hypothetical protein
MSKINTVDDFEQTSRIVSFASPISYQLSDWIDISVSKMKQRGMEKFPHKLLPVEPDE